MLPILNLKMSNLSIPNEFRRPVVLTGGSILNNLESAVACSVYLLRVSPFKLNFIALNTTLFYMNNSYEKDHYNNNPLT